MSPHGSAGEMCCLCAALGRWMEKVGRLSATDSASWNLMKSIYAPQPLASPVMGMDCRPPTKRQQAQALANMYMARSTKEPHAPEMKIPSARRGTLRLVTEAEMDVALRELSSGTAPGDDQIRCEELKQLGGETKKCVVRLFNCSLRTGQVPAKWRHGTRVPIMKANEPASSMGSFRSVTLTSTLPKLMESTVACLVSYCTEEKQQQKKVLF
ncbi:hypothetical protein TRVL_08479 [Trypanosoma vivax]|uniref:Uncharacterized protein n=1 Tax=Trypanosoma vivax (strain Y486) TaxID=1055687 RepID=F9WQ37_TRYVY|nr:hypothetical protein TRVL_08479 [Trypanosoma vivax]CCD19664.1 hypothetical protein, conserved [Trypanosoma vivax Y486]|eukprot:CCD19664.1 hypothetical protein, conserved [Trypanosoma vivax Y486]